MSKHNYTQYSKKNDNVENVTEAIIESNVVEPVVEVKMEPVAVEPVVEPVKPVVPKPVAHKPVIGTVFNCSKLNVRSEPASDADIMFVLDANSEVEIDMSRSAKDWYKICTAAGVDGFCMRRYVKL